MPLGIHGAPGIHLPKIGVDRFTNYIQVHCISFPFDQMTAMTALVSGGVFDRHPQLRVAFLEAGVGWVPFFIDRLHEQITIVVITHRLSTIRNADRIHVLDHGHVVDSGTWRGLVATPDGRFRALCAAQGIDLDSVAATLPARASAR